MAEVIDLKQRRGKEARIKDARLRRRAQAVAECLACGACPRRCGFCGGSVEDPVLPSADNPYNLCPACQQEYRDYLRRRQGDDSREAFWHNQAWLDTWRGFVDMMEGKKAFRASQEFQRLFQPSDEDD